MLRRLALISLAWSLGCTPRPAVVVAPRLPPEVVAARLAEADRLASHGCYLCLKEAGAAYAGQPAGERPNPATHGDAQEGTEPRVSPEREVGDEGEEVRDEESDAAGAAVDDEGAAAEASPGQEDED